MQEDKAQKIVNSISKKQKCTIRSISKCDRNGEIRINLNPEFKPNEPDATYSISLIKFAACNNITNLNESNNKFVYKVGTTKKTLTLPSGFYSVKEYDTEVKRQLQEQKDDPAKITITINEATGFVSLILAGGYSVLFNEANTFRNNLGFDAEEIKGDKYHTGKRICNLLPTQSIFIHCSAVRGNRIVKDNRCENSNIIFDFALNYKYGAPITFMLSPKLTEAEIDLSTGKLEEIVMSFKDDNGSPVIFGDDPVSVTLRIKQD